MDILLYLCYVDIVKVIFYLIKLDVQFYCGFLFAQKDI